MKEYLDNNFDQKVYVGISAGSVVAGIFLPTGLNVELYGEDCEADHGTGMEFFSFIYLPHLNSPYFPNLTNETIESKKDQLNSKVIATDDFTAIKLDDGKFSFVGSGERWENNKN